MIAILFTSTIIVGIVAIFFGIRCLLNSNHFTNFIKLRTMALALIAFGFVIHTLGDYLEQFFGDNIELSFESIAHIIIMIAFIILLCSSKKIFELSKEHGFKT